MGKQTFFMKLLPPRPTFGNDMTPWERAVMQEHILYWKILIQKGICVTFGPVLDPGGVFGVAIVNVDHPEHVEQIAANDPSILNGINRFESFPMIATFS